MGTATLWFRRGLAALALLLLVMSVGVWATARWTQIGGKLTLPVWSGHRLDLLFATPGPTYDPRDYNRLFPHYEQGPLAIDVWYYNAHEVRIRRLAGVGLPAWPLATLSCMAALALAATFLRQEDTNDLEAGLASPQGP